MKKLLLISLSAVSMAFTSYAASIDASSSGNWSAYMNWFELNADKTAGGYVGGGGWGNDALPASWSGSTLTLAPNTNTYADNINGDAGAKAYWSNSSDGGTTMGPDGGKYMQAIYKLESGTDYAGQSLNISGTIDSNTLDSRYSVYVFGKTLVNNVWSEAQYERVSISSGTFSFDFDVLAGDHVAQLGFMLEGSNANPSDDWGNIQISGITASAVPEPSTYALIAGFAAFMFVAIRRRK